MAVQRGVRLRSIVLLLAFLEGLQACGRIAVESPVIHFGYAVTATCTISYEKCATLKGGDIQILWTLDDHKIPGSQRSSTKESQSNVTISSFDMPEGTLSCYAAGNRSRQLIDRVQIRAGYPPSKPKDLSCVMNVTDERLTCTWNPGQETNIETKVALERYRNRGNECGQPQERKEDCTPEKGQSSCTIPRKLLNLYQKVDLWVTATNALGSAKSESLCLVPMDVVKLDPPTIQKISSSHFRPSCLSLNYTKPSDGSWIEQWFELRYRPEHDVEWSTVTNITRPFSSPFSSTFMTMEQCGFHTGLNYQFQIRCIKHSLRGYWSNWSHLKTFLTPEGAPTGRLQVWWKAQGSDVGTDVQLMWKPMSKKEAGGQILRYLVSYSDGSASEGQRLVCNTTEELCHFLLPREITRVSVQAENAAGRSVETEVILHYMTGRALPHVRAYPRDDQSLWVEWEASNAPVRGYVLEWCRVTEEGPCSIQWKLETNSSCKSLLEDGIEPFKLFKVLLYPLYQDTVGLPVQTEVYSKEKEPSRSPKLQLMVVGKSQAELMWEPVPLEQRNGFITNYTVFWKDERENIFFSVVSASSRSFLIQNLDPSSTYQVHLMSSTSGGSTNGTILTLQTTLFDEIEISILCASCFLALCLPFIIYLKKHKMKSQFWPNVPDPAKSSSGKWIPANLQEENKLPWLEAQHVITCDITILEKEVAAPKTRGTKHLQDHLKTLLQEYNGGMPEFTLPGNGTKPPSYVNTTDSVEYAKVIVGNYRGQRVPAPIYVRSNSTRPLLDDMTPSPTPYENLWFHGTASEEASSPSTLDDVCSTSTLEDVCSASTLEDVCFQDSDCLMSFPLLQGLKIEGTETLSDFPRFPAAMQNRP